MRSFQIPSHTPDGFVDEVRRSLAELHLDSMVSLTLEGDELVVRLSRLGTTVLRYQISRQADGFRADLVGQRVARLHAPFQRAFEERLAHAVRSLDGRLNPQEPQPPP